MITTTVSPKYSSIHFLYPLNPTQGGLLPISAVTGRETGYTLDRLPETTITLTPRNILESPVNLTCMFWGGGRKLKYPERIRTYTERTCKHHTERPPDGI